MSSTKQPSTFQSSLSLNRLPALDGVRGIAVLCVLLDHASDAGMQLFPGADLNRLGKYGVYLFFILSAFLLTDQFHRRRGEELVNPKTWIDYANRRFLRIFPLYAVVLVAFVVMEKLSISDLGTHLLLQDGKRVFWTIAVEVKFYMILPLLIVAFFWAGRKQWWFALLGGGVAAAAITGFLFLERMWSLHPTVLLAPNLAPFLLGAATAIAYGYLQGTRAAEKWGTWFEIAAIGALLTIVLRIPLLYNGLFADQPIGKFANDPAICGALWSVVLLGILQGRGWLAKVVSWQPLRYLGLISFSAYLWHWKFLSDVDDLPVPSIVRLFVFLTIVIAVATASYFLLERPLLRLRRHKKEARNPVSTQCEPKILAAEGVVTPASWSR